MWSPYPVNIVSLSDNEKQSNDPMGFWNKKIVITQYIWDACFLSGYVLGLTELKPWALTPSQ